MNNILISADTHFSHLNISIYTKRPVIRTGDTYIDNNGNERWVSKNIAIIRTREMNNILINDWNKVVGKNDLVYHLGDVCFGDPTEILRQLNGKIILIPGNHDRDIIDYIKHTKQDKIRIIGGIPIDGDKIFTIGEVIIHNQLFSMSHFAMEVWNKSHHGAWHLFGHSHGSLQESDTKFSMDVGVDAHYKRYGNFSPFTFNEISEVLSKRKFVPIDHHTNIE